MTLIQLFLAFARIGLFTIGGGFAMIPLIQEEAVKHFAWISQEEFIDIIAIAQITPGAISINSATYIGFKAAGLAGSIVATVGLFLPSLIIVVIVAGILLKYQNNPHRQHLFSGIRPVVAALIAYAVFVIGRAIFLPSGPDSFQLLPVFISLGAFGLLRNPFKSLHPILVLLICAIAGMLIL